MTETRQRAEYSKEYQLPTPTPLELLSYAHKLSIGGDFGGYNPRSMPMGSIIKSDGKMSVGPLGPYELNESTLAYVQSKLYPQYSSNFAGFIIMACAKYFPTHYHGMLRKQDESIPAFISRLFGGGYSLSSVCKKSNLNQYEAYKLWLRTIHFTL